MTQSDKTQLFYELHGVTQLVRKHFDRRATRLELTRAQWRALKSIGRFEGLSQTELAKRARVENQTMSRTIERLEREGFVTRAPDAGDRRIADHNIARPPALTDLALLAGTGRHRSFRDLRAT